MRVAKVTVYLYSVIRLKIQAYLCEKCCKQQCSKKALSFYNFNPKGIIIFPYADKQIVLLINPNYDTMEKTISNHKKFWEIIIPNDNTIWEK